MNFMKVFVVQITTTGTRKRRRHQLVSVGGCRMGTKPSLSEEEELLAKCQQLLIFGENYPTVLSLANINN